MKDYEQAKNKGLWVGKNGKVKLKLLERNGDIGAGAKGNGTRVDEMYDKEQLNCLELLLKKKKRTEMTQCMMDGSLTISP